LKVLHLYAGNLYGGVETLLTTLARLRHLAPEMKPEFGLCFRGRVWDELAAAGVPVHDLGPVRLSRPWTVWRARRRLKQVLERTRPEVVVVHSSWPHVVFAPAVRRAQVRIAHFVHEELTGRNPLEWWAARNVPDLVLAHTPFTAEPVGAVFPGIRVERWLPPLTPPPVDDAVRPRVRSELGTPEGTVVILQASRLERWKGQAVHLAALERLNDVPGWMCWVAGGAQKAGEAGFLAELRSAAERSGIADRVRFLGQRADVPRLMAAADVYCQPNTGPEPFGITLVEALSAGLPVVTSALGGAAEIVDETCGVLTTAGDTAAVAAALRGLIRDSSRRRTLGAAGPNRAESLCDPQRALRRLAALLSGVARPEAMEAAR
jgi:glycosyltransferase involved in cell wall biosynthesis